jgi:hypothetical protein
LEEEQRQKENEEANLNGFDWTEKH